LLGEQDCLVSLTEKDTFIKHIQEFHSGFCLSYNWTQEVKGLEERVSEIQQVLGDLKVQLYAKFGNNINLEADES
uniref:Uncharacterized protein n=1 Tax=Xiphophorus couchianus TaxID=32473 RepID=A0A3B5KYI3_9TELE